MHCFQFDLKIDFDSIMTRTLRPFCKFDLKIDFDSIMTRALRYFCKFSLFLQIRYQNISISTLKSNSESKYQSCDRKKVHITLVSVERKTA